MKRLALLLLFVSGCTLRDVADELFYGPVPAESYLIPASYLVSTGTPDGETIHGVLVPGVLHPDVAILYCHGRGANLDYYWSNVLELARTGYTVAALDYRGFGRSTGTPSEEGLRTDARAFLAMLEARGFDRTRLAYYGMSLGGAVCIDLAASHPPAALVTESTFTSVEALVHDGAYADLPPDFFLRSRWDSLDKIARIDAPYLAMHGLADTFVDPRYARELAAVHPGRTELVLVPEAEHEDVPARLPDYAARVGGFVARSEHE